LPIQIAAAADTVSYVPGLRRVRMTQSSHYIMKRPKVSIIGAGAVGAEAAAAIANRRLGEVFLFDVVEDLAIGKAMDINHARAFFHTDSLVTGSNTPAEMAASDVVVITAGAPRRAGMQRKDLLGENLQVLAAVGRDIMEYCPRAIVLVVTNPVEPLTWLIKEQCPDTRVLGLGCSLDTVRFRFFLSEAAGVSIDSVSGIVIGSHNDAMIPLVRHATIGGAGIDHVLDSSQIARVVRDTRQAGADIVANLKTRGSFYAASQCVAEIVESFVRDTRAVFPLSVVCSGEYGFNDTCLALPASVGLDGVNAILDIGLTKEEREALDLCAAEVRQIAQPFRVPPPEPATSTAWDGNDRRQ